MVLMTPGHEYKTYAITGNDAYSFEDIAGFLTEITGKKVTYLKPDLDTYIDALGKAGVPKEVVGFLGAFSTAIRNGEFDTQRSDLEQLLGRKPTELTCSLKFPALFSSLTKAAILLAGTPFSKSERIAAFPKCPVAHAVEILFHLRPLMPVIVDFHYTLFTNNTPYLSPSWNIESTRRKVISIVK